MLHSKAKPLQVRAAPAVHLVGEDNVIGARHGLGGRDGRAVAGAADVAVQALELDVLHVVQRSLPQPRVRQHIAEARPAELRRPDGPCNAAPIHSQRRTTPHSNTHSQKPKSLPRADYHAGLQLIGHWY